MKTRKISLILLVSMILSAAPVASAEEIAVDRATRVEQIKSRWNPLFDQQYSQLVSLASKAKLDPVLLKNYKYLLDDFLHVRQVIDAALNSSTGDIEAAAAYAEEETGEFMMAIPELASQIARIKSITCFKGKVLKKVTGTAPKCPAGYKKK
jgi:hypothetical protein